MSKNTNLSNSLLPSPTEKVYLGITKTITKRAPFASPNAPLVSTSYGLWKLPGSGIQWVKVGKPGYKA